MSLSLQDLHDQTGRRIVRRHGQIIWDPRGERGTPLGMVPAVLENLIGGRSLLLVNREERQNQGVELGILELPRHGTLLSLPLEDVLLGPEEMLLPVIGDVGDDSSEAPHVSRGSDVGIVSPENLGSQVADSSSIRGRLVVHGRGR